MESDIILHRGAQLSLCECDNWELVRRNEQVVQLLFMGEKVQCAAFYAFH